jgi:hypothetical protein
MTRGNDRVFTEVFHSTLEDDISIASRFFLDKEKASVYALKLLDLLPPGTPVGIRSIYIHTCEVHPIVKADTYTKVLRQGESKENDETQDEINQTYPITTYMNDRED